MKSIIVELKPAKPLFITTGTSQHMDEHWKGVPELPHSTGVEEWVRVSGGVSLRVLLWKPNDQSLKGLEPVVVVPGWGSVFEGWRPLITEWVTRRPIIYIETREKASAVFDNPKQSVRDFTIEKFSNDLVEVIHFYKLGSGFDLFSSSLGSTILIDALHHNIITARSSVFVAPNQNFKPPFFSRMMVKMPFPNFTLNGLVKLAIWAIERKVKEEGQRIRYRRTLLSQDAVRTRLSARSLIHYELPKNLSKISVPCGIISAKSDKLHGLENVKSIVERIPGAQMIEVPSNQYAHEAAVLVEIEAFHNSI